MHLVNALRFAWRRHIAGLSHVSRTTANTFVYYKVQGEDINILDAVAQRLYDEYCNDRSA